MEGAINVFTDGLVMDNHPLTQPKNSLSDALNATFRTFNGNELMLQNDMGNSKIQDSRTGNIMGLNPGFVPIGMKEYGGVLYIASYNQQTGEGELGTIPSPLISFTLDEPQTSTSTTNMAGRVYAGETGEWEPSELADTYSDKFYLVSNRKLHVGERYMIQLNFTAEREVTNSNGTSTETYNPLDIKFTREMYNGQKALKEYTYPFVTATITPKNCDSSNGWYIVELYAIHNNGNCITQLDTSTAQIYQTYAGPETSNYWFIDGTDLNTNIASNANAALDLEQCIAQKNFRIYPNIPDGYLAIKIRLNTPDTIKVQNNSSTQLNSPLLYKIEE